MHTVISQTVALGMRGLTGGGQNNTGLLKQLPEYPLEMWSQSRDARPRKSSVLPVSASLTSNSSEFPSLPLCQIAWPKLEIPLTHHNPKSKNT
eukprot:6484625-Amphidinium_carterae.1